MKIKEVIKIIKGATKNWSAKQWRDWLNLCEQLEQKRKEIKK